MTKSQKRYGSYILTNNWGVNCKGFVETTKSAAKEHLTINQAKRIIGDFILTYPDNTTAIKSSLTVAHLVYYIRSITGEEFSKELIVYEEEG